MSFRVKRLSAKQTAGEIEKSGLRSFDFVSLLEAEKLRSR